MSTLPAVCFLEDVCEALRISRRTLEKLRRHGAFPIPELPTLDKRPRFSGAAVQAFLESGSDQVVARLGHAPKVKLRLTSRKGDAVSR